MNLNQIPGTEADFLPFTQFTIDDIKRCLILAFSLASYILRLLIPKDGIFSRIRDSNASTEVSSSHRDFRYFVF